MTAPTLPATPAGELVGWFEAGSDQWHAARASGIGGSEISAVLGISPFESYFSLWHRKQGLISPVEESDQMRWGKRLEAPIVDEFADLHPETVVMPSPTYRGTGRPWQIVNPDRLLINGDGQMELLEVKTSRDAEGWGEEDTDQIPVYYKAQVRWYMDALGIHRCRVIVLISGSDYREYIVEHDEADAAVMRERAAEFMRTLRDNERPAIDGHDATYQAIKQLPDGLDDVDIQISPDLRAQYFQALADYETAKATKQQAAGLVLDQIGTGRRAVVGLDKVATRTVRNGKTYSLQPARNRSTK
ncbi:YqaJ viral recombinase family nuclease [Streptomyces antimycoticus]